MAEPHDDDFEDTPEGWASRWHVEIKAAQAHLEPWHRQVAKIAKRRIDKRDGADQRTRWNFFAANQQTQEGLLFGRTPQVDVSRRFADSEDDVARVASEILERVLNANVEDEDGYEHALRYALQDDLLGGFGLVRLHYDVEMRTAGAVPAKTGPAGEELAPEVPESEEKEPDSEDVTFSYVHWRDALWPQARIYEEVRWFGYRAEMTRRQLRKRFGEDVARDVPVRSGKREDDASGDVKSHDPWARAEVWEIWSKEHKRVFWVALGAPKLLDSKEDPLELESFFPHARPLASNVTTTDYLPTPDFCLYQDLYDQIDEVAHRRRLLVRAIRAAGLYDKAEPDIAKLVDGGDANMLVPVGNWAALSEKGGLAGAVQFLPMDAIAGALQLLTQEHTALIETLYQLTGMSDILRGQATGDSTATEQSIKARFASVRLQQRQDGFARFATGLMCLRAEIIAKHCEPGTIARWANVDKTADAALAPAAIQLIKDGVGAEHRIQVKPEAVALTDFAALKSERIETLTAIGAFVSAIQPLVAQSPEMMQPAALELLKWLVSGLRGASPVEAVLDRAIAQAQQAAQQPKPPQQDPKAAAQMAQAQLKIQSIQAKAQADQQKTQGDLQADLVRQKAEVDAQGEIQREQTDQNLREHAGVEMIRSMHRGPT